MVDISPNFWVHHFATETEAIEFLERLGFTLIVRRSDYDVYETKKEPKKRATMYQEKDGRYFVGQQAEKQ